MEVHGETIPRRESSSWRELQMTPLTFPSKEAKAIPRVRRHFLFSRKEMAMMKLPSSGG